MSLLTAPLVLHATMKHSAEQFVPELSSSFWILQLPYSGNSVFPLRSILLLAQNISKIGIRLMSDWQSALQEKKMCENIGSPRAFKLTLNKHWIKLESYTELLPKTHLHSICGFISPKYLTCVINPISTHRLFSTTPAVALYPHVFFFFFLSHRS